MNIKATLVRCWSVGLVALLTLALSETTRAQEAPATQPSTQPSSASLLSNSDLEADADNDAWPDGWPRGKEGCTWEKEGDSHFLRLKSSEPGKMVMYYREVPLPKDAGGLELSWKQRVSDLKKGKEAWFDARIMLEFANAAREKVSPAPAAAATGKNTDGWQTRSVSFLVPEGATMLKLMPCLFNVQSGTFDLDDITLKVVDPAPLKEAAEKKAKERKAELEKRVAVEQARAAKLLTDTNSLIANGNLETDAKKGEHPEGWGTAGKGVSYEREQGNRFLRITSTEPDKMVSVFREIELPADAPALEMSWRYRLTDFKRGELPWYDARFILKFVDAEGKHIGDAPPAAATKMTDGWVERKTAFLVPEGALRLQWMPTLFQVQKGTFDIDDVALRPTDPAPILAAKAQREKEERERYVAPETDNRAKWPSTVHVQGNRLVDPDGKEVWLQGVNAGGLETLHADMQVLKSVVVAIDEWKANAIRLPMNETFWFGRDPTQKDGGKAYREKIDQIITLCANRGAYLILDLHRFRAPKAEHVEFWKDAAARYKDHPAVLFDLFNEPHDISWEVWQKGGFVGKKGEKDESAFLTDEEKKKNQGFESPGMQAMVDAVRSTGAKNVVIAAGLFWSGDLSGVVNGYALEDKSGNGIMYSWHQYNWHKGWPKTVVPVAEKYPIFVGECGADTNKMSFIPAEDQEDPHTWVPDMLGFIQKYRLNWTGWCLHPKATPVMISDWSYTPTPFWGEYAKQALAGKQFEMKRMR
jgi:hypothetical protein